MSVFHALLREWGVLLGDRAVVLTIFGGALFYAALYPQPYLQDRPQKLPLAVLDFDHTATSRQLLRWVNASPDVRLTEQVESLAAARRALEAGTVRGVIFIPARFEQQLQRGTRPVISIAGDANYFLIYGAAVSSLAAAAEQLGGRIMVGRNLASFEAPAQAIAELEPIRFETRALFNESMGYLGYVIPAVFVLILHQTMLLAAALRGAGQTGAGSHSGEVLNRTIAMALLYLPLSLFYFIICFAFYGIPRLAGFVDLLSLIALFLLATSSLGTCLGVVLPQRPLAAPVVLMSSLPLVFSAGFIWPRSLIPEPLRWISDLAPSTPAIQAFLELNQMGASFDAIKPQLWHLALLMVFYLLLSQLVVRVKGWPVSSGSFPATKGDGTRLDGQRQ